MNKSTNKTRRGMTFDGETDAEVITTVSAENNNPSSQAGVDGDGVNSVTDTTTNENQTDQDVAGQVCDVEIAKIGVDEKNHPRDKVCKQVVAEYAAAMKGGAEFPAVVVFFDGALYWLADGGHRIAANLKLGKTVIRALVHKGTRRDATLFALEANAKHGCRRTNADRRKGVRILLADAEWRRWGTNEIAKRAGVSWNTVRDVWLEVQDEFRLPKFEEREDVKVERKGKTFNQRAKRKPAAPEQTADSIRAAGAELHRVLVEAAAASELMEEALRDAPAALTRLAEIAEKVAAAKAFINRTLALLRRMASAGEAGVQTDTEEVRYEQASA